MNSETYVIYKHTAPSGKCYIGVTKDYKTRVRDKRLSYKNCPVFYNAILKHGWENFNHEIIDSADNIKDAELKEKYYIEKYRSTEREFGYNICIGGDISKNDSSERRKKISESMKKHRFENKEFWEIASKKISKTKTGKKLTKEHIEALRKNHVGMTGKHQSDQMKKIMHEKFVGRPTWLKNGAKPVNQYSLDDSLIQTFSSMHEAAISVGLTNGIAISKCCNGIRKTAGGYKWKHATQT